MVSVRDVGGTSCEVASQFAGERLVCYLMVVSQIRCPPGSVQGAFGNLCVRVVLGRLPLQKTLPKMRFPIGSIFFPLSGLTCVCVGGSFRSLMEARCPVLVALCAGL